MVGWEIGLINKTFQNLGDSYKNGGSKRHKSLQEGRTTYPSFRTSWIENSSIKTYK